MKENEYIFYKRDENGQFEGLTVAVFNDMIVFAVVNLDRW